MGRPDPARRARRCAAPRSCCRSRRSGRRPARPRRRRGRTPRTRPAGAGCRTRLGVPDVVGRHRDHRREQRRIARDRDVVRGADEQAVREVGPVREVVEASRTSPRSRDDRLRLTTDAPRAIAQSRPAAKARPLPRLSEPRTRTLTIDAAARGRGRSRRTPSRARRGRPTRRRRPTWPPRRPRPGRFRRGRRRSPDGRPRPPNR